MSTRKIHIILLLLVLVSCQREALVDLDVPQKRKLVAALYVGANAYSATAFVTQSQPVLGSSDELPDGTSTGPVYVTNATGTFTNIASSESWWFIFDPETQQYIANMDTITVKAGQQYKVQFSDENETVEGTTTVPLPVNASITATLDSSLDEGLITRYKASITCTSLSEGTNYIRLVPILIYSDSNPYPMTDIYARQNVFSLKQHESTTQTFTSAYGFNSIFPVRVEVMVIACDEAYMKYYNSTGFNYDQFGPLADPTIVYSNMSNKVGVIASYNVSAIHPVPFH